MEFHMINITYTALHMRSQTEKTIFSFKDDYIDEAHTALDIFCFVVFFYLFSVSLGNALTTAAVRPFFS